MRAALVFAAALAVPIAARAQTAIASFASKPIGLVSDAAGNVYGSAPVYFGSSITKFFAIDPGGTYTEIFTEALPGLGQPAGPLSLSGDTLFGASPGGGILIYAGHGHGTLIKLKTDGSQFAVLHQFTGADGTAPIAAPQVGPDGALYGTTTKDGPAINGCTAAGVIYRLGLDGALTVLHSFGGQCNSDGATPSGQVFFYGDILLGTTSTGGASNKGTVWSYDTSTQSYTIVRSWMRGNSPVIGAVGTDGAIYGAATNQRKVPNPGTIWEITGGRFSLLVANFPQDFFAPTLMSDGSLSLVTTSALYHYAAGSLTQVGQFPPVGTPGAYTANAPDVALPTGGVDGTGSGTVTTPSVVYNYTPPAQQISRAR